MNQDYSIEQDFLTSALSSEGSFMKTQAVIEWVKKENERVNISVNQVKFREMNSWFFTNNSYNLKHETNGFFSIDGINVSTNFGKISSWDQPIINQPEIGYLGFITKKFNGVLHFLVQAKIEPGNINHVQLSPTIQATKSNYLKLHKGKTPKYLKYFQDRKNPKILLDQLQSEQGARFLRKRNRNIIIQVFKDIKVYDEYVWLTLGQIKKLILVDNLVNMDTRTVISGINYGSGYSNKEHIIQSLNGSKKELLRSIITKDEALNTTKNIIAWITELKCKFELHVTRKPLNSINNWFIDDYEIKHETGNYFKVIATQVEISNREVNKWMQPLIKPAQEGLIAFIIKKINGIYHFLVQAKVECGNFDVLELAPTVQCLTGNYQKSSMDSIPYLDVVLKAHPGQILLDTLQSEEGGRFYKEQNRNVIILVNEDFDENIPDNFCWMTLNQLNSFLIYNNYLNIQSRSLIASISLI